MKLIDKIKQQGLWQLIVIGLASTTIILFLIGVGIYSVSIYKLISNNENIIREETLIQLNSQSLTDYQTVECLGQSFKIPNGLKLKEKKDVHGCFYNIDDKALYIDQSDTFQISGTKLSEVMTSNHIINFQDESLKQLKLDLDQENNLFGKILIAQQFLKSKSFIWFLINPAGAIIKNSLLPGSFTYRYQKINSDYLIERKDVNTTTYYIYTNKNSSFQFLFDTKTINNISTFFMNNLSKPQGI